MPAQLIDTLSSMTVRNSADSRDPVIEWIAPRGATPFVRLAAEAIAARLPRVHGAIDGTNAVVCVPTSRAARLLAANLLEVAEAEGSRLDPPVIVTAERLADRLVATTDAGDVPAAATLLERTVAWRRALAESSPSELRRLGVRRGDTWTPESRQSLASVAVELEDALGREGKTFADAEAIVPAVSRSILADDDLVVPDESERWSALAAVRERVVARLASAGLAAQVDRERRLVERGTSTAEQLYLVGFLEVSGAVRRLASLQPVTVVLPDTPAPEGRDAFGVPRAGGTAVTPIPLDAIRVAGSPRGQADEAIAFLSELAARPEPPASDEVAIGVADSSLVPTVAAALRDAGLGAHEPAGRLVSGREPFRALAAALSWYLEGSAASLAMLARCPAVTAGRSSSSDETAEIDALLAATCLHGLEGTLPVDAPGDAGTGRFRLAMDEAMEPLAEPELEPMDAANAIAAMLSRLGVDRDPGDRALLEQELARLAAASPLVVGRMTPCDAAALVLEMAAKRREPAEPRPEEIELLGWLELLFEPAPHLCIVGMNEGSVPDRGDAVAWLTPSMASALGLPDPDRRLARDAAMLDALRRFHPGLRLVFGRRSAAGDPTMPSRLLLGGSGPELATRVRTLFREPRTVRHAATGRATTAFTVPQPPADLGARLESMSVTDFKVYLADPYRYWLERYERLGEIVTDAAELDARIFGTLAHDVIEAAFFDEEIRASTDAGAVREAFRSGLDRLVQERFLLKRFGERLRPAIRLQLHSLQARLDRLAEREVEQRRAGWTIHETEAILVGTWLLEPAGGGKLMRIRGRLDRIERNDSGATPRYRVLDAKTSENPQTPREAHRAGRGDSARWTDLQLPLYRHFAAERLKVDPATVATGYIQLPPDPGGVAFAMGDFTDDEYADAVEEARRVVARIRAGDFTPGPSRVRDDPLRFIRQEAVFGGGDDDASEGGEGS
jgi:ATP-dependent helicase/nuclease subunit B